MILFFFSSFLFRSTSKITYNMHQILFSFGKNTTQVLSLLVFNFSGYFSVLFVSFSPMKNCKCMCKNIKQIYQNGKKDEISYCYIYIYVEHVLSKEKLLLLFEKEEFQQILLKMNKFSWTKIGWVVLIFIWIVSFFRVAN